MLHRLTKVFVFILVFIAFAKGASAFTPPNEKLPCLNKRFSIIAHIVLDSLGAANVVEQDILDAVDDMNGFFEPICVSFEVCEFRYITNFEYDTLDAIEGYEWNELLVTYHEQNRINMFFVTAFAVNPGFCGFAKLSGITDLQGGGICILKECVGPGQITITHEMGHYFGLPHTWEGSGIELVNGSNCTTVGDAICDTPADPFFLGPPMSFWVQGCRFVNMLQDANGEYYDPIIGNIMSYYPGSCACGFTPEQFEKMVATYNSSNPKMW